MANAKSLPAQRSTGHIFYTFSTATVFLAFLGATSSVVWTNFIDGTEWFMVALPFERKQPDIPAARVQKLHHDEVVNPYDARVQLELGLLYSKTKNLSLAMHHWRKCVSLQSSNSTTEKTQYDCALQIAETAEIEYLSHRGFGLLQEPLGAYLSNHGYEQADALDFVLNAYSLASKIFPGGAEAFYGLAKIARMFKHDMEYCFVHATVAEENFHNGSFTNSELMYQIEDEICVCGFYTQQGQKDGLHACIRLDDRLRSLEAGARRQYDPLLQRTMQNIRYYLRRFTPQMGSDVNNHSPFGRIAASFTTAHRAAAFKRTFHSFMQRCLDCTLIEKWIVVDDFSTPGELQEMQRTAPPCAFDWIQKAIDDKGHVGSMNTLLELTKDFDYLVHLEDDWLYIKDDFYILKALQIMDENATISQVLFNEDFLTSNLGYERENLAPGVPTKTPKGLPYVMHRFVGFRDWPAYQDMVLTLSYSKNYLWVPYFSLQPGVWRLSALRDVGSFHAEFDFEFRYGIRYMAKGWRSAFLPGIRAIHLQPSAELADDLGGSEAVNKMFESHGLSEFTLETAISAYALGGNIR